MLETHVLLMYAQVSVLRGIKIICSVISKILSFHCSKDYFVYNSHLTIFSDAQSKI